MDTNRNAAAGAKRSVAIYNMIPNLFWSVMNLLPVAVFCYEHVPLRLLYVFIGISLLTILLPWSFFDRIQLAKNLKVYKRLGVHHVNRFTQNGTIVNTLIRRKYPSYKVVSLSKVQWKKLIQQTYIFEKFHFMMLVFFTIIMVYALANAYYGWAVIIMLCNLIYNVYPNWLQQYIRLRLRRTVR